MWKLIDTLNVDDNVKFDVLAKTWCPSMDIFSYKRFTDCSFAGDKKTIRYWKDGFTSLYELGYFATHWMPLPENPKC